MMGPSVLWFRHGLRIHDNPALLAAIANKENGSKFLPIFIFDSESAGTKTVGYNRMRFLLDALNDLDNQFRALGGRLYYFRGKPTEIFRHLSDEFGISTICYEQDCEPIWRERDNGVEMFCNERGIRCIEKVSHTLWDPHLVISANGGIPPLTYQMFLHTVQVLGPPTRPAAYPVWTNVKFLKIPEFLFRPLNVIDKVPCPEDFDIYKEYTGSIAFVKWIGGETQALENLENRLIIEQQAFEKGEYLPNHSCPDILGAPTSLSAHLRFGCLSVRRFYWAIHDLFDEVRRTQCEGVPSGPHITGQLIWREYFYTMSVNNIHYGGMENNEICLNIPWAMPKGEEFEKWKFGRTGFPLIDAAMRQLLAEGWLHHILRNTVSSFLTRGALWLSWEIGLQHFLKYLLDADWSVCAGNWMWVSSSAFEKLLDSSQCTCPIALARRLDPNGEYITRYVPELRGLPKEFIHEPWKAPEEVQENSGCVIGIHYPPRIVDLDYVSERNNKAMKRLRDALIAEGAPNDGPPHCRPSNENEIRQFFWLVD